MFVMSGLENKSEPSAFVFLRTCLRFLSDALLPPFMSMHMHIYINMEMSMCMYMLNNAKKHLNNKLEQYCSISVLHFSYSHHDGI